MKWWFYDLMKENTNRSNLCMKNKCIGNLRRCTFSDYATNVHNVGYAHALLFQLSMNMYAIIQIKHRLYYKVCLLQTGMVFTIQFDMFLYNQGVYGLFNITIYNI